MSSRINLNDNTSDRFEFTLGGLDFDLFYPTMEEIKPLQEVIKKSKVIEQDTKLSANEKEEKLVKCNEELSNVMYNMIRPVGHTESIKNTLEKQPFPVVKAFNKMLSEQLSAE